MTFASGKGPKREADSPGKESAGDEDKSQALHWYAMMGLGLEFAAYIGAFGALGWYLDRRWDTSPWMLVAGLALGLIGGVVTMVKSALRSFKD